MHIPFQLINPATNAPDKYVGRLLFLHSIPAKCFSILTEAMGFLCGLPHFVFISAEKALLDGIDLPNRKIDFKLSKGVSLEEFLENLIVGDGFCRLVRCLFGGSFLKTQLS